MYFAARPVIIPLIDSSRQELSNGCHIVILSNFDLIVENTAVSGDLAAASHFLTPFLTEPIGKVALIQPNSV